ncbi:MAG: alanine racemase [Porticoccaceae bacterium]|nr:alanine racemase [Porticoccaceae bacterium]
MSRPAEALINLANIRSNFALANKLSGEASVMAVIKANAYGHGALAVARALPESDAFGVACLAEAIELRKAGIAKPIVLLGGVFDSTEWPDIERHGLQVVIHAQEQLESFLAYRPHQAGRPFVVWLKLDSGMHRLGFSPSAFARARRLLIDSGKVQDLVLMSHFACADEYQSAMTDSQLTLFKKTSDGLGHSLSMANSAALITCPDSHFDWVRPGIMLYGVNPLTEQVLTEVSLLLPAMTLRSRLLDVRDIPAGDAVGYGEQWQAPKAARIGTVAIGYGDGYPRHAVNGTPVLIGDKRAALAGRVSMDYISVDLSHLPEAQVGDEVVLWGEGLPVEEVAAMSGTIAYELLTGVRSRVSFRYVDK